MTCRGIVNTSKGSLKKTSLLGHGFLQLICVQTRILEGAFMPLVISQPQEGMLTFLIQFSNFCQLVHCWTIFNDSFSSIFLKKNLTEAKQNSGGQFNLANLCLSLSFSLFPAGYLQLWLTNKYNHAWNHQNHLLLFSRVF